MLDRSPPAIIACGVILLLHSLIILGCGEGPVDGTVSQDEGLIVCDPRVYAPDPTTEEPDTEIVLELIVNPIEEDLLVYWSVIDPDDPADDITIDPNGGGIDDNLGGVELSETPTLTDVDGKTEVKLIAKRDNEGKWHGGDNYQVIAYKGSWTGPSVESEIISLWKRMHIEYDHQWDNEPLMQAMQNAYGRDPYTDEGIDVEKANKCAYIEVVNHDVDEAGEPLAELSMLFDPWVAQDYADNCYQHRQTWTVHLMGICMFHDHNQQPLNYGGWANLATGYDSWAYVCVTRITEMGYGEDMQRKVPVHEIGHYSAELSDAQNNPEDHNDPTCVMNSGDIGADDPHFCPKCVVKLRTDAAFYPH